MGYSNGMDVDGWMDGWMVDNEKQLGLREQRASSKMRVCSRFGPDPFATASVPGLSVRSLRSAHDLDIDDCST